MDEQNIAEDDFVDDILSLLRQRNIVRKYYLSINHFFSKPTLNFVSFHHKITRPVKYYTGMLVLVTLVLCNHYQKHLPKYIFYFIIRNLMSGFVAGIERSDKKSSLPRKPNQPLELTENETNGTSAASNKSFELMLNTAEVILKDG